MSRAYRSEQRSGPISAVVEEALMEIKSLRDEMNEIVDNMSSANMEHLPKCETAEQAVQELDEHCDLSVEVPPCLTGITVTHHELVNRRKGRGPSREIRLSNACAAIQACVDALENDDHLVVRVYETAANELRGELDEHCDVMVDFPGMYG